MRDGWNTVAVIIRNLKYLYYENYFYNYFCRNYCGCFDWRLMENNFTTLFRKLSQADLLTDIVANQPTHGHVGS